MPVNSNTGGNIPSDFQSHQIERILDALSLALPQRTFYKEED
jgi:hypothetical protein